MPTSDRRSTLQELFSRPPAAEPVAPPRRRRTDNEIADVSGPRVVFEQVSRQPYDISYSCLLIPRFSAHYLIGDIAEDLREWLQQLCISSSWRLESVSIRPEYMQWVLYVPAATPPSRCIRTIREYTSQRILEEFPHIKRENLSADFWAPGNLVLAGPTPLPSETIDEHIRLIRQQQGIQPRFGR